MTMRIFLVAALIGLCAFESEAWQQWKDNFGSGYWWGANPKFWINTSVPANFRPGAINAMNEWKWSGAKRFPYYGGLTGRDCGDGDYWWDDDDGYNVFDYWNKCNNAPAICDRAIAGTRPIDTYTTTTQLAEVDIVMCSNVTDWLDQFHLQAPIVYAGPATSFQAVATHEFGHALGLWHTGYPLTTILATMYGGTDAPWYEEYNASTLSWDDVDGIESIYAGACNQNEWVLQQTSGQNVTRTEQWYERCGVTLQVKVSTPTNYENWLEPARVRNGRLGGFINEKTYLDWEEFDRDHAAIVTAYVTGVDNVVRELNYVRNGSNHWYRTGWLGPLNRNGAPSFNNVYNSWVACRANLYDDYRNEYGVVPYYFEGLSLQHFVNTQWPAGVDKGAVIKKVRIHRYK